MKPEIYKDEGYKLMGAAFEVYNERGYGLGEEIYRECMEIELDIRTIPFQSKRELACLYKGRELKKRYVPDLYIFDCVITKLKAVSQLAPEHEAQLINYLRLTRRLSAISSISGIVQSSSGSGSSSRSSLPLRN